MNDIIYDHNGDHYEVIFCEQGEKIRIEKNDFSANYKVKEDFGDYTFYVKKTQVNCCDIHSLNLFFGSCLKTDWGKDYLSRVINTIIERAKPIKRD